jgi:hypothetical protein
MPCGTRRTLRYRSLVIKQMVQMKNRVSGLLMETGVGYNKQRLHCWRPSDCMASCRTQFKCRPEVSHRFILHFNVS